MASDSHSPVYVKVGHYFREGEVLGNGSWDSHLVNIQVGVWSDHGSCREVHPFTHQVPSNSSLLALQTLLDGLERTPPSLKSLIKNI